MYLKIGEKQFLKSYIVLLRAWLTCAMCHIGCVSWLVDQKTNVQFQKSFLPCFYLQPLNFAIKRLLNNPYVNGVNLTKQNPLLKCRQHLETLHTLKKGLDLLMLKILGLQVKGLQSYQLSKLEFSKKVCRFAPALFKPVGPDSSSPGPLGSNHSKSLIASNFAALLSTDFKFLA